MEKRLSGTSIDLCLQSLQDQLVAEHGYANSERMMWPLLWYINSGRASTDFLHRLINAPGRASESIRRALAKGGSYDDVINAICRALRYKRPGF